MKKSGDKRTQTDTNNTNPGANYSRGQKQLYHVVPLRPLNEGLTSYLCNTVVLVVLSALVIRQKIIFMRLTSLQKNDLEQMKPSLRSDSSACNEY